MINVIKATVIGGIILFAWGSFSWLVLDLHRSTLLSLPDEAATVSFLQNQLTESGLYWFPQLPAEGAPTEVEGWFARHREGATGMLLYRAEGIEAVTGTMMGIGFILHLATAFIVSWIVWLARGSANSFLKRLGVVVILGVVIAIWSDLVMWNWMHYPADYCMVNAAGHVFGMLLMGLPVAMIVKE
jgi:hypothetical protein